MIRLAERVLVDTHVVLWVGGASDKTIPASTLREIDRSTAAGLTHVSAITGWEIAMLASRGRIETTEPVWDWFRTFLGQPGIRTIDVAPDIAVEAALLPGRPPADPADRILIATARLRDLTLVTADQTMLGYAEQGHVRVMPVA